MFYLCILEFDETVEALRVALMPDECGSQLQSIEADSWIDAREIVDGRGLRHVPGYGWFLKSSG